MEDFPERLPEKLKQIRERLGLTPDDLAPFVWREDWRGILAYENDEDDREKLLFAYSFGLC